MKPKNYKRGYPVAVLVGIEADHAALWHIFSQVAKPQQTIPLTNRKDQKALYSFHETLINALRPVFKEGVRSIIVASPPRTSYAQDFLSHVKAHHTWLLQGTNKAALSPNNRFRKLPPTSRSPNKNQRLQTAHRRKRHRRNRKPP